MHKALQGEAAVHLRDMAALLGVSEMTVRRDLVDNAQGLRLLGGHVTRSGAPEPDYQVAEEDQRNIAEKRQIGVLAASLVRPGDTIFIDCGTTTPFIIDALTMIWSSPRCATPSMCCSNSSKSPAAR